MVAAVAGATVPRPETVLEALTVARLGELARELQVTVPPSARKDAQIGRLIEQAGLPLGAWLGYLVRDELRAACRQHQLDASGRSRAELAGALLAAAGLARGRDSTPPPLAGAMFGPRGDADAGHDPTRAERGLPAVGDIVVVRHRQYLVDAVVLPRRDADGDGVPDPGADVADQSTRVSLIGLDDDNQGRRTEVLWELELGAHVLDPRAGQLGQVDRLDPPRTFGAFYNALRWNRVTATDARLFQAPFRAGVKLMMHQLTPLKRALALPRANLFIADDVGLGKTIEAGLVLQELLLRNQVELVVIVAPASVCPQWQGEMARRFGLHFELYNRAFVQRRRQERGFGVNPWCTHSRFIISYQTLRRPEYEGALQAMLDRDSADGRRTLLILDEAHTAAPASSSRYAVPSDTTDVIMRLAPRFDHRLFLSATPHNGHSNSFSTLLSLLDRQRFTRGVKPDPRALEQVMVRRLKSDLRALAAADGFPERKVIALRITEPDLPELELARLLAEYTRLAAPGRATERLVFVNLQKRLLSSVRAFARTLDKHAERVGLGTDAVDAADTPGDLLAPPGDEDDVDDDLRDEADAAAAAARTGRLDLAAEARALLTRMVELAHRHLGAADAKIATLLAWIRTNQCPAAGLAEGRAGRGRPSTAWTTRRLIIFTEYGDTKSYLQAQLEAALGHTDDGDQRVMVFHGGMSDDQRALVQRAFNSHPDDHPVRILVATDAAREGLNLQAHCADLFHFDVPWNPARMEQRNGRIDRALQPSPEVRCHYLVYQHRAEDAVLETLVRKVEVIGRELGSLATVVLDDVERVLARGIADTTLGALDGVSADAVQVAVVTDELEQQRDRRRLERDLEDNARIVAASSKTIDVDADLLRETLDVGLGLLGAPGLEPTDEDGAWRVPVLPEVWKHTLDTIRPPRERDEEPWEWRERPLLPVVFEPPAVMREDVAHLHLSHPVTQRILSRLLAQGFAARDLSRVCALAADVGQAAVLGLARLSLFGAGAERLHDELIVVGAHWAEDRRGKKLRALPDRESAALRAVLDACLHDHAPRGVAKAVEHTLLDGADGDLAALWPAIEDEADAEQDRAGKMLTARALEEAAAMRQLLDDQRKAIERELASRRGAQLDLQLLDGWDARERAAYDADTRAMARRQGEIDAERVREPARIEALYQVALRRLTPVGLVYLWPTGGKRVRS